MANQYANATISEQVRIHGEMLARLTALVEQDHEDLKELKQSVAIIAKADAARETRELTQAGFKAKIREVIVPLLAALIGVLASHFLLH